MDYIDLDGGFVTANTFAKARTMVEIFHEHCQKWAREDDFPEGVFEARLEANEDYPQDGEDHYYWGFRAEWSAAVERFGFQILTLYVATSDELHGFDLVGFFEEGELVYLISRVDTSWSEVWVGDYPHGQIDMSRPYERVGRFPNSPKED